MRKDITATSTTTLAYGGKEERKMTKEEEAVIEGRAQQPLNMKAPTSIEKI